MQSLVGMDAAFLSLETPTTPMHVGVVLVLDPPEGTRSLFSPSTRYAQIRRVIQQRLHLIAPAAAAGPAGAVRAAPPGVGRRSRLRPGRPPQPGQPALARRAGGARRLRGRGHEPPARSGPPALGDARRRGPGGGAHRAGGQGAPRHPRRGERCVRAGGLPGPDAADPHCGAAAGVGPRAACPPTRRCCAMPPRRWPGSRVRPSAPCRPGWRRWPTSACTTASWPVAASSRRPASSPRRVRRSTAPSRTASASPVSPSRSRT